MEGDGAQMVIQAASVVSLLAVLMPDPQPECLAAANGGSKFLETVTPALPQLWMTGELDGALEMD